jgi:hypothetical protein
MSDQPATNGTNSGPGALAALRDARWLAGAIWVGLLLALLFTSSHAVSAFTQGGLATAYFGQSMSGEDHDRNNAIAMVGLTLSGGAALALLGGWWGFVRATKALVIGYSYSADEGEDPMPAEWVLEASPAEDDAEAQPDPTRTMVSDVLQYVGIAWAVIIMTPAVLSAVRVFA